MKGGSESIPGAARTSVLSEKLAQNGVVGEIGDVMEFPGDGDVHVTHRSPANVGSFVEQSLHKL